MDSLHLKHIQKSWFALHSIHKISDFICMTRSIWWQSVNWSSIYSLNMFTTPFAKWNIQKMWEWRNEDREEQQESFRVIFYEHEQFCCDSKLHSAIELFSWAIKRTQTYHSISKSDLAQFSNILRIFVYISVMSITFKQSLAFSLNIL